MSAIRLKFILLVRTHCSAAAAAIVMIAAVVTGACTESSSTVTTSPDAAGKCGMTVSAPPIMGADGGNATINVTTQPECAWNASTTASWITGLTPTSGQGNGSVAYRVAVNDGTAARDGEIAINDTKVRVSQRAPCVFTVTPPTRNVAAAGEPGNVTIATTAECAWTATTDVDWIVLAQPVSGSGNGTVNFTVSANSGAVRTGNVIVGGQRSVVTQAASTSVPAPSPSCTYAIAPPTQNIGSGGGPGTPISLTTQTGCPWGVTSNASWITITSPTSGSGSGSVTFTAAANTGAQRTGTLTIASIPFTLTQAAGASSCTYSLSAPGANVGAGTSNGSVGVTAGAGCQWTATSNAQWITITGPASGSGNGSINFSVAANTGAVRNGTITVAGQTFTVNQAAGTPACVYSIAPPSQDVPSTASTGTVTVTSGSGCAWTASSNAQWLTITSGTTGTANGTVGYNVAANTGVARSGTLTIAGQPFTVNQAAVAPTCNYALSSTTLNVAAAGIGGSVNVTTGSTCSWTAVSNAQWITITSAASGTGNGTVAFTIATNTTTDIRTGVITIGGQTLTITQAAPVAACSYSISPPTQTLTAAAQTATVTVTAGNGCTWTAVSNALWIAVTGGASGTGNGTVTFSVQQNTTGAQRTGTLTVATLPATVVQGTGQ